VKRSPSRSKPHNKNFTWKNVLKAFNNGEYERKEAEKTKIKDMQFREHLKQLEANQPGVYQIRYENDKTGHLVTMRKGFGSKSEKYRRKEEFDAALSIQADSGVPADGLKELLHHKDVKNTCVENLKIQGRMGVKDSLDFQTTNYELH